MPVFPDIPSLILEDAPNTSAMPPSMYVYPNAQTNVVALASLVAEVSDMKNLLQTFSSEILNLKRQQAVPLKPPYQDFQGSKPPF